MGQQRAKREGWPLARAALAGAGLLMLAGCGGGGGVASTSAPPTTGTTTTPVVAAVNYDDAEYQRSNAAVAANAVVAYNAGATGAGETIAILDSGIADVGGEFAGRISSASRDFGGSGSVTDVDGHGTAVAAVAAAARNGNAIEGIAFGATVLALRTDTTGSCATSDGCAFNTATLAIALDYARTSGAKVINLSLGGAAISGTLSAAINRATAAGIIIVVAAGNDGTADPDPFAQVASSPTARGLVIIAGSHDADGTSSSFSDKAGGFGQYYLAALGSRVRSFDATGTAFLYSGTSFSTPAIAAAVALLEQAFPNLTPAQVVALLYSSATDAGAAGIDPVYGQGLLNLTRAFRPAGSTSLAGSAIRVAESDATILSPAMGDANFGAAAIGRAVVLDSYGRAFGMDVTANVGRQTASRPLGAAMAGGVRTAERSVAGTTIAATVAERFPGMPWAGLALGNRGVDQAAAIRPLSGSAVTRLGPRTRIAFAFAESGQALDDRLAPDRAGGSFLAARAPGDTPGFAARQGMSVAVCQAFGRGAVDVRAERGTLGSSGTTDPATPGYTLAKVHGERWLGAVRLGLGLATLDEVGTLLGARLAPALGRAGATTRYLDLDSHLALGGGWSAGAMWRQGWTRAAAAGIVRSGRLDTSSAALDLAHVGQASRFALRLATPPRVTAGGLLLSEPTSYDYASGAIGYSTARIDLAPRGRERDVEADAGLRVAGGWLEANLYLRSQPGNIALAPDDLGTGLRYSLDF